MGLFIVNGLVCMDGVIILIECEFFLLCGLVLFIDIVDKVCDWFNLKLDISGILIICYDLWIVNL